MVGPLKFEQASNAPNKRDIQNLISAKPHQLMGEAGPILEPATAAILLSFFESSALGESHEANFSVFVIGFTFLTGFTPASSALGSGKSPVLTGGAEALMFAVVEEGAARAGSFFGLCSWLVSVSGGKIGNGTG